LGPRSIAGLISFAKVLREGKSYVGQEKKRELTEK
jgi:hypothetical protein